MTGLELLDRLVADGVSFPIIFITGHADAQGHRRAIQAGAVAYLRKPVDAQDVLQAIQHSLGPQVPEP
jgi:FixJ family two-component response regulator